MKNIGERVKKLQKNREKLSDIAYMSIKKAIVNFECDPGSYLSENMLAEVLGMSRTPVREAIKILAQENLVEVKQGGIYISDVSANDLKEIYDARKALECEAMRTARTNFTHEEIESFRCQWKECLDIVQDGTVDWETISTYDRTLHTMFIQKSNNSYIKKLMKGINAQISRYQYLSAIAHDNIEDTIHQHLEIIDCIEKNDSQIICRLGVHIDKAANNILNVMLNKQICLVDLLKANRRKKEVIL